MIGVAHMAQAFNWSVETTEQFKQDYLTKDISEVTQIYGLTKEQVYNRAQRVGVRKTKESRRFFTKKECELLKELYPSASWEELTAVFDRPREVLARKASALGVARANTRFSSYTPEEDEILRKYFHSMPMCEIQSKYLPHRSVGSMQNRSLHLGLKYGNRISWTPEMVAKAQEVYFDHTIQETADIFGVSRSAIERVIKEYGLVARTRYNKVYTEEEIAFVGANYKQMSDIEIAEALQRPRYSIKNLRHEHDWFRPPQVASVGYDDIYQYVRKNNAVWFKKSKNAGGAQCFITGNDKVAIHHLYGMHMILDEALEELDMLYVKDMGKDYQKLSKTELRNILQVFKKHQDKYPLGICVDADIHKQFHSEYGYGRNTPDQFEEFVQSHYPKALDFYYAHIGA